MISRPRHGCFAGAGVLVVGMAACTGATTDPGSAPTTGVTDPAYAANVERWHQARIDNLKKPDGWLSLVGLHWLDEDGRHSMGSAADAKVQVPRAPDVAGTLTKAGPIVVFDVAPGASATVDETPAVGSIDLRADSHDNGASKVRFGDVTLHVIDRAGRLGVRVKDPQSAARQQFDGVPRFPVDQAWKVRAQLVRHAEPTTLSVPTVIGTALDEPSPGVLTFEVAGQTHELHPVASTSGLFVVFGDQSNGLPADEGGTYGGGRFLSVPWDGTAEVVELDFNQAINPPCAFTAYATCPLPPPENKLSMSVPAGEKAMPAAAPH